jgi:hypothetical protein
MLKRKCGPGELIVFCFIVSLFSASGKAQDSVADAARKNHPKDAQAATKRVWTDDDFSATGAKESTAPQAKTQESPSEILRKFRYMDKEELSAAVLKRANAPNVDFPRRKDWEQRLLDAKNAWSDQVDRMVGHKDSNNEVQAVETRLAQTAQQTFERTEADFIQQARAVADPMLRARLEYERQRESCLVNNGKYLDSCLAALEVRKAQMQKEGTW